MVSPFSPSQGHHLVSSLGPSCPRLTRCHAHLPSPHLSAELVCAAITSFHLYLLFLLIKLRSTSNSRGACGWLNPTVCFPYELSELLSSDSFPRPPLLKNQLRLPPADLTDSNLAPQLTLCSSWAALVAFLQVHFHTCTCAVPSAGAISPSSPLPNQPALPHRPMKLLP